MSLTHLMSRCAALALTVGLAAPALAATAYNEGTTGDLSNLRATPTAITIVAGDNDVLGTTGLGFGGVDLDYLTFTIAAGYELSSLKVLAGTQPAGGVSFLAIQSGAAVTVDPAAPDPAPLLGWAHFSDADIGTDILPAIGVAPSAIGFVPPLGAGTYSLWIQDTNVGAATYALRLGVTPVPEPHTVVLALAGLAALAGMRRRRT